MSVFRHVSAAHGPSCETPVAFFVFNRPRVTARVLAAIAAARPRQLFVICDGPRPNRRDDHQLVQQTRQLCNHIPRQCDVRRIYADKNLGCKTRVSSGLEAVFQHVTRAIILEDDCVPHLAFFRFCEQLLQRYERDTEVVSISGANCLAGNVKSSGRDASYYFSNYFHCWGWATWQRGWKIFEPNGQFLLDELVRRHLIQKFDYNGAYPFSNMLQDQIKGANDSWAIRWHASAFLAGKLTLYPGRSLVHNSGNDGSGTHCGASDSMDIKLSKTKINLNNIAVESSRIGREAFEIFFRQSQKRLLHRLLGKARCLFRKK